MSTTPTLMQPADWAAARPDLYPQGLASFDWRWRTNKRRYLETGAVLIVSDRRMIDPQACEQLEMTMAREAGQALLKREAVE